MSSRYDNIISACLGLVSLGIAGYVGYDIGKNVGRVMGYEEASRVNAELIKQHVEDILKKQHPEVVDNIDTTPLDPKPPRTEKEILKDVLGVPKGIKNIKDIWKGLKSNTVISQLFKNPDGIKMNAEIKDGRVQVDIHPGEDK